MPGMRPSDSAVSRAFGATRRPIHDLYRYACHACGGRPLRPPDPLLEPEDGTVHFWRPQQDSHHQSRVHAARVQPSARPRSVSRRHTQEDPVCRHQACRRQGHQGTGGACRYALRRSAVARRHVDQLQDDPPIDPAPEGTRDAGRRRDVRDADEEGGAQKAPHDGKAAAEPGRHQGYGRVARRPFRH